MEGDRKNEKEFWKEIGKHKLRCHGRVRNFQCLGGRFRHTYLFSFDKVDDSMNTLESIAVKLHTRKNVQNMIFDGDILLIEARLKKGEPMEPEKVFNVTKKTSVI